MKREFLQNFKVGDQPLPKDVIDARPNPKREYDRNVVRDKKRGRGYFPLRSIREYQQTPPRIKIAPKI